MFALPIGQLYVSIHSGKLLFKPSFCQRWNFKPLPICCSHPEPCVCDLLKLRDASYRWILLFQVISSFHGCCMASKPSYDFPGGHLLQFYSFFVLFFVRFCSSNHPNILQLFSIYTWRTIYVEALNASFVPFSCLLLVPLFSLLGISWLFLFAIMVLWPLSCCFR